MKTLVTIIIESQQTASNTKENELLLKCQMVLVDDTDAGTKTQRFPSSVSKLQFNQLNSTLDDSEALIQRGGDVRDGPPGRANSAPTPSSWGKKQIKT